MSVGASRQPLIDALKVVASQLIVLHHLAFYGPMTDHAEPLMPGLVDWFGDHARIAVQVFLVVGGYLAVQRIAPRGRPAPFSELGPRLVDRYLRLMLPLSLALLVAVAAAALARGWMAHDSVPASPEPVQVLAHLLLAQDLLGLEALSAGVWYVAIDFQLYAALALAMALVAATERWLRAPRLGFHAVASDSDRASRAGPWVLAAMVTASALHFNRQPDWDVAAPYFLAAYGLGALAAWAGAEHRAAPAWWTAVAGVAVALAIDPRDRLALALAVALGLWTWQVARRARRESPRHGEGAGGLKAGIQVLTDRLARSSYAMFLVHFPVLLVVNAWFSAHVPARPWPQLAGVVLAWGASIAAGELFHRFAERPIAGWLSRWREDAPWPDSAGRSAA